MGIPGLWDIIDSAKERQSLASAGSAADGVGTKRIAIDVSIWSFQCAAAGGGDNPVLRTFYARLCRLANTGVKAIFVFDGTKKPTYKRGKRTGNVVMNNASLKKLVQLFGFVVWQAPGEAEAECAHLQALGIADAVLTDDVDALIFGATLVYRHWAAVNEEGKKSTKFLTHTLCYSQSAILEKCRLTVPGLILVALLAGGDYFPAGVPKCGILTAVEIAVAGFGETLLKSLNNLGQWRQDLQASLSTNPDGHFRCKHPSLLIPSSFPDLEILRYYTNPVVTSPDLARREFDQIDWHQDIDYAELRSYTQDYFDWQGRPGDAKLIRTLAQPIMSRECLLRATSQGTPREASIRRAKAAASGPEVTHYPITVHGSRKHKSSGHLVELRIEYTPLEIVPIVLQEEGPTATRQNVRSSGTSVTSEDETHASQDSTLAGSGDIPDCDFDFEAKTRVWLLRSFVEQAFPALVSSWDTAQSNKILSPRKTKSKAVRNGTLDGFVRITKQIDSRTSLISKPKNIPEPTNKSAKSMPMSQKTGEVIIDCDAADEVGAFELTYRDDRAKTIPEMRQAQTKTVTVQGRTRSSRKHTPKNTSSSDSPPPHTLKGVLVQVQRESHNIIVLDDDEVVEIAPAMRTVERRIKIRTSLPGTWREAREDEQCCETLAVIDLT